MMTRGSWVRRGQSLVLSQELNTAVSHVPLNRTGSAKSCPIRAAISEVRGDKNYDTHQFVKDLLAQQVTPHGAQHMTNRASAIDGRTTRHLGYTISQ